MWGTRELTRLAVHIVCGCEQVYFVLFIGVAVLVVLNILIAIIRWSTLSRPVLPCQRARATTAEPPLL